MQRSLPPGRSRRKDPQIAPSTPAKRNGLFIALCLVIGLTAFGATWAFAELVLWNKLPGDLVGKWVVEGGEQDGATFDFYRNGSMVGHVNLKGTEGVVQATAVVKDGNLRTTTRNPNTGDQETRSQKIVRLDRKQLILQDERGIRLRLARADE
jgi:hypothetical protein